MIDCLDYLQEVLDNPTVDTAIKVQVARDLAKYKHRALRPKDDITPDQAPTLTVILSDHEKPKKICLHQ